MYGKSAKIIEVFSQVHLHSEMGAMLLDSSGCILFINESGRRQMGCTNDGLGANLFEASLLQEDEIAKLKIGQRVHREVLLDFNLLRKSGLPTPLSGYRWALWDIVAIGDRGTYTDDSVFAVHFFNISYSMILKSKFGRMWQDAQITFWEYDPSSHSFTCSQEVKSLFGLSGGDEPVNADNILELIHPDDRDRVKSDLRDDIDLHRTEHTFHCRGISSQGNILDLMVCYTNVFSAMQNLICRHGLIQDITSRKEIDLQLQESQKNYKDLFESMENAFALHEIILDSNGQPCDYRFLDANPAFKKHTGLEPSAIKGKTAREVLPETENFWIDTYGKVARSGQSAEFDSYSAALDKHYHIYAFSPEPMYFATVFSDITERKLMEQSIIDNEEIFRNLFKNIPDSTFLIDMDEYRFIRVNAAAIRQYGYSEQELLAMSPSDVSDEPELSRAALKNGVANIPRRKHKRKDGSIFQAEISLTSFELDGRHMVVATVHDLSRNDLLAGQLIQAQKMEALGRLSGGVAHDFNNILQVIVGFGQMLIKQQPTSAQGELLGEILNAARRGKSLADRMLAFSRRDFSVNFSPVDINKLLTDFRKVLAGVIGEDIRFKWHLQKELPLVSGDEVQIEQVVMNLCINARDAMTDGGELTITTTVEDLELPLGNSGDFAKFIRISVADTGIGMTELIRSKVFEPFFTTKQLGEGTGLGLASSYAIIERHGGYMSVESSPGLGSEFHFWLPIIAQVDELDAENAVINEPTAHGLTGTRILLAEDDSLVRNFMVRVLEHESMSVTQVDSGDRVIEILQEGDAGFDLIIMDVIMPGLNGAKAAEKLREFGCRLPILFTSGYSQEHIGENLGGTVLRKPFGVQELLQAIRQIILTRQATAGK